MQGSCRPGDRARCGAGAGLPRETLPRVGKRQVKPWEASLPQLPIGCRGRDKESLEGTVDIWEEAWMGTGEKPEKAPVTWIIEPPPYLHISPLRQLLTRVVDNIL